MIATLLVTAHIALSPVALAAKDARRLWHAEPCRGRYGVVYAPVRRGVSMYASWERRGARFVGCVIHIGQQWSLARERSRWSEFAADFMHEWGHLLGRGHSDNPRSVMYPVPGRQAWLTGRTFP